MRTTLELPDDLFQQIEARAAMQGKTLRDVVADALRLLVEREVFSAARPVARRRTSFPLIHARHPPLLSSPEALSRALLEDDGLDEIYKALAWRYQGGLDDAAHVDDLQR